LPLVKHNLNGKVEGRECFYFNQFYFQGHLEMLVLQTLQKLRTFAMAFAKTNKKAIFI